MKIKGIKYFGPIFDHSGYGQASRGYVLALNRLGVPLTLKPITFEKNIPDWGKSGEILSDLVNKDIDYNIVILHTTPEFWEKHKEPGKINIGYCVWETTKLHEDWPEFINNNVDGVMVGCEWNKQVFEDSGIKVPVFVVPHGIDTGEYDNVDPYVVSGVKKSAYKFYNIDQFTERKHPTALIKSYWAAFRNNENVALILKTYRGDFSDGEKDAVRNTILKLKDVTRMGSYPPIYLVLDMLTRKEILGLHKAGDCFVSLNRGEGFGLSGFESGSASNPIIVTGLGGVLEYAKPEHSYLVNYNLTPVFGMNWSPWYNHGADEAQMWAEPDCGHAIKLMRHVYNNQEEAIEKGRILKKYIAENLSWDKVGQKMLDVIKSL